ncbi:unnamed protein product [Didymodactylos carnosus]|uniref:Uncharacterized protein n=1 Tax=Didymodactylos carnosus TaxID=1234261 RepID=A0A814VA57_9BILA|nr:unnamed protein product [Didymodactylos carnosus]CAF1182656.1 unnamed protein product [Didymodactylos carnosus]CAF3814686.1 unnamed protein product [Didymodactylos carnosus]CAF3947158.1 unnamed protein product [Didymodactylos carnosus]
MGHRALIKQVAGQNKNEASLYFSRIVVVSIVNDETAKNMSTTEFLTMGQLNDMEITSPKEAADHQVEVIEAKRKLSVLQEQYSNRQDDIDEQLLSSSAENIFELIEKSIGSADSAPEVGEEVTIDGTQEPFTSTTTAVQFDQIKSSIVQNIQRQVQGVKDFFDNDNIVDI